MCVVIDAILYFDFDCNFTCYYLVVERRPLLKGVYGNALYGSLKDFYNSKGFDESGKFDECIMLIKNIPNTIVVVGSVKERHKTIPAFKDDTSVKYHQKNRLHYAARDVYHVVNDALKDYLRDLSNKEKDFKEIDFMLDFFGPEEMYQELVKSFGENKKELSSYVRVFFEQRAKR